MSLHGICNVLNTYIVTRGAMLYLIHFMTFSMQYKCFPLQRYWVNLQWIGTSRSRSRLKITTWLCYKWYSRVG